MISACQDEISTRPAETVFTLRLHEEIKFRPGKAGQFSTWKLIILNIICMHFFCKHIIFTKLKIHLIQVSFRYPFDFKIFYLSCLVFNCVYSFSENKKQSFAYVFQSSVLKNFTVFTGKY